MSRDIEHHSAGERTFKGIGVAPGIAIGPAYIYTRQSHSIEDDRIDESEVNAEISRFNQAVGRSERDLKKIAAVAREKLGEESAKIFEAQLMMVQDPELSRAVGSCIRRDLCNAAYAVWNVLEGYRKRLEASNNEIFRDRATDLDDITDRIVRHLRRGKFFSAIDADRIVFAETLSAADVVLFSRRGILACATDFGGATSHVSIMARALRLPAVVSLHGVTESVAEDDRVIVDGLKGVVVVNPTEETLQRYRLRKERYTRVVEEQRQLTHLPAETLDGVRIQLMANLEFKEELPQVEEYGAEGVGLFRTEVLFLMEGRLTVTEEEQYTTYKKIVESVGGGVTTFRVLDLGGDKMLPVAHREYNPFLGWRGIRVLLDKPELAVPQLRALLRASAHGPIRILVPMVTSVSEIRQFRAMLDDTKRSLKSEGFSVADKVPVGAMVEVPAVALMADVYAREVDFLSLGTNDLTQYVLAVDRGNDLVSSIYQELHPAVLRLIKNTIDAGAKLGIPVSLCGEMGSNSSYVPVLVGLGLKEISASPVYLPEVKRLIRAISLSEAEELANEILELSDPTDVLRVLEAWLSTHPFDVIHSLGDQLEIPDPVTGKEPTRDRKLPTNGA